MINPVDIQCAMLVASLTLLAALPNATAKDEEVLTMSDAVPAQSAGAVAAAMNMPGCNMNMMQMNGMGSPAVFDKEFNWKITPQSGLPAGKAITFAFNITRKSDGWPLADLQLMHEKPCHLVVVSRDLKYYQHIHPQIIAPGKMRVTTRFPAAGQYVFYLQFSVRNQGDYTLKQEVSVGNTTLAKAHLVADGLEHNVSNVRFDEPTSNAWLDDPSWSASGPYKVKIIGPLPRTNRAGFLTVSIEHNGKPVEEIQPFLGTGGHGAMVSEDLSQFLHIHPDKTLPPGDTYKSPLRFFIARLDKPGIYRTFLQFKIDGKMIIGTWNLSIKN